jgi:hypothetical protein
MKPIIVLITSSIILFACKQKQADKLYTSAIETLRVSNKAMQYEIDNYINEIKAGTYNPEIYKRALQWLPAAEKIKQLTSETYNFLENCEWTNNMDSAVSSTEIYGELVSLQRKLSVFNNAFSESQLQCVSISFSNFTDSFDFSTNIKTKLSLSILKNQLNQLSLTLVSMCKKKMRPGCDLGNFRLSYSLITQSSKHVKKGEMLTITGGIGYFAAAGNPVFTINGKTQQINYDGVMEYHLQIKNNPGKYKIPVTISYIKPDGTKGNDFKNIEYIVE